MVQALLLALLRATCDMGDWIHVSNTSEPPHCRQNWTFHVNTYPLTVLETLCRIISAFVCQMFALFGCIGNQFLTPLCQLCRVQGSHAVKEHNLRSLHLCATCACSLCSCGKQGDRSRCSKFST